MIVKVFLKDKFYFLLTAVILFLIGIQFYKAPNGISDNLGLYTYPFIMIALLVYTGYQNLGSERENKVLRLSMTASSIVVSFFIWWGTQLIELVACVNAGILCSSQIQTSLFPIKYFYLGLPLVILFRPKNKLYFLVIVGFYFLLLTVLAPIFFP